MINRIIRNLYSTIVGISIFVFATLGFATLALAEFTAADSSKKGSEGSIRNFESVEVAKSQDTRQPDCVSSAAYVDITGMNESIAKGGSPAVVMFQYQPVVPSKSYIQSGASIRLVVDNVVVPESEVTIQGTPTSLPIQSWHFTTPSLSSSSHTIKLQWKAIPSGSLDMPEQFCMQSRSMLIFRP